MTNCRYVLDRILSCDTTLLRLPLNLWFDFENKKFGVFSYISAFVYKFSKSDIVPNDVFGLCYAPKYQYYRILYNNLGSYLINIGYNI